MDINELRRLILMAASMSEHDLLQARQAVYRAALPAYLKDLVIDVFDLFLRAGENRGRRQQVAEALLVAIDEFEQVAQQQILNEEQRRVRVRAAYETAYAGPVRQGERSPAVAKPTREEQERRARLRAQEAAERQTLERWHSSPPSRSTGNGLTGFVLIALVVTLIWLFMR